MWDHGSDGHSSRGKGHALLIDTRSLDFDLVPVNRERLANTKIIVCNSSAKYSVATGEYGKRRKELKAGQQILRHRFGVLDLGDARIEQLEQSCEEMGKAYYRRCRHVLSENRRVLAARDAMMVADAIRLGELLSASHVSQRDDFECSCDEIDFLVQHAMKLPGCFGSRLTGGGFGGCTISLVEAGHVENFQRLLQAAYKDAFNIDSQSWVCEAVDGAFLQSRFSGLSTREDP